MTVNGPFSMLLLAGQATPRFSVSPRRVGEEFRAAEIAELQGINISQCFVLIVRSTGTQAAVSAPTSKPGIPRRSTSAPEVSPPARQNLW
jgi:hypothetical protein